MPNILAISGSLRKESVNLRLISLLQQLSSDDLNIVVFEQLGEIPFFNPDIEANPNNAVLALRKQIDAADLVLIASPEYAHGITGVLKNALDWLVGSGEFTDKLTALPMVTERSEHSPIILKEVITVMGGNVDSDLSPVIKIPHQETDLSVLLDNEVITCNIKAFLKQITATLHSNEKYKQ